jgi:hypothetical protein
MWPFSHAAAQPFAVTQMHPTEQRLRHPTRWRIEVLVLAGVALISISHLILSHLASHFRSPKRQMAQTRRPDLHVAHPPKLLPASAEQRRHLPSTGDSLGGVAPVFQGVPVAFGRTDPISAAVKPTTGPTRHSR